MSKYASDLSNDLTDQSPFRGFFRIGGKCLLVFFDSLPVEDDPSYTPGAYRGYVKAQKEGDCFHVDDNGRDLESVSGLVGYGGPEEAAKEAVRIFGE